MKKPQRTIKGWGIIRRAGGGQIDVFERTNQLEIYLTKSSAENMCIYEESGVPMKVLPVLITILPPKGKAKK